MVMGRDEGGSCVWFLSASSLIMSYMFIFLQRQYYYICRILMQPLWSLLSAYHVPSLLVSYTFWTGYLVMYSFVPVFWYLHYYDKGLLSASFYFLIFYNQIFCSSDFVFMLSLLCDNFNTVTWTVGDGDLSSYSLDFKIRIFFRKNKNDFELLFECELSPVRIQTLTWSHPCCCLAVSSGTGLFSW